MTQRPTRPLANVPRVIVTRHLMPEVEARMRELFDVVLNASDVPLTREQLAKAMQDCDVLVPTVTDRIDADLIAGAGERLGLIANFGAGTEHIDLPAAAARKILDEKGIASADVAGSGRGGRVTKEDAVAAQPKAAAAAAPAVIAAVGDRAEERVPMTRLRARIAERLLQSKNENAILTTFNEVNMAPVMALRKQYGDKFEKAHGVRLGFMGFFVKAAVAALKKFPILNASVDGNDIVYHGYIDIGIAVGSPRGLVVPILRNAESMSIAEIELKIAEFGEKAKGGKLSLEDLSGGTFSISNGGVFGSMMSTPIINPPQSAILGIHATKDRAVVENGQVVVRPINYLAMSYDHRIIDGREAVLGLVTMKEALEDPARLILDV